MKRQNSLVQWSRNHSRYARIDGGCLQFSIFSGYTFVDARQRKYLFWLSAFAWRLLYCRTCVGSRYNKIDLLTKKNAWLGFSHLFSKTANLFLFLVYVYNLQFDCLFIQNRKRNCSFVIKMALFFVSGYSLDKFRRKLRHSCRSSWVAVSNLSAAIT